MVLADVGVESPAATPVDRIKQLNHPRPQRAAKAVLAGALKKITAAAQHIELPAAVQHLPLRLDRDLQQAPQRQAQGEVQRRQ